MSNEIIPTGTGPTGLSFWQNRELARTDRAALLEAAVVVAEHRVDLVKNEVANVERLQGIRHTEERGQAAIQSANRVIDAAIDAVGDNEFKSHHISKIVNRTTARLADLA